MILATPRRYAAPCFAMLLRLFLRHAACRRCCRRHAFDCHGYYAADISRYAIRMLRYVSLAAITHAATPHAIYADILLRCRCRHAQRHADTFIAMPLSLLPLTLLLIFFIFRRRYRLLFSPPCQRFAAAAAAD